MRSAILAGPALLVLAFAAVYSGDAKTGVNDEGFITSWLLLAPIPLEEGQNGADALTKQQIKDEAKLQPKPGEKIKVGGKELAWKAYTAKEHLFDFNDFLGAQTENSVGYAVCYIHAPADMKDLKLKIGSDDQAKVFLNGKEVVMNADARPLDKDQNSADVALVKGVNVLVFKVVNESIDWSGCARFVDKLDAPVRNLKITLTPELK